jgi:hypothetical protein
VRRASRHLDEVTMLRDAGIAPRSFCKLNQSLSPRPVPDAICDVCPSATVLRAQATENAALKSPTGWDRERRPGPLRVDRERARHTEFV